MAKNIPAAVPAFWSGAEYAYAGGVHWGLMFLRATESGGPSPIPAEEIFEVSRVAIDVAEGLSDR